ncbi:MAG: aminoacyl-tRNA hydrolase [Ruminococcaceae bacterium]|nr:aminoacyl-tRNA hydrolase [Oscillospiraceae bacterium]
MLFKKSKYDFVVVGLGNPGTKYDKTRHNVGFRTLDLLIKDLEVTNEKSKFQSLIRDAKVGSKTVLLVKPQTFMNNSGSAVSEILQFYKIEPEKLIVISDDVSMDEGRLRIRASGSHGGHNGLRDIIELLGTDKFPRVRVGVGQKPHPDYDLADWVLGKPDNEAKQKIDKAEEDAAKAVVTVVTKNLQDAMSKFNR